jgi:predicted ribosome quality control (RQC) complex YloA/Tae2 family protein
VIRLFKVSFLVLATLLGGCVATTEPNTHRDPWYQAVVEPMQGNDARALRFYENVLKLKGAELARELNTTRQEFDKDQSELNRVRLALLLSLPGTGYRDDQAALNLVQPFVNDKSYENSVLRPLALMLHAQLSELKRLDEALQQQTAKAKEELSELKRLDEALQQQTAKAKEEQRRADALQQKLEAILDMEMKMIEREQTTPPKRR